MNLSWLRWMFVVARTRSGVPVLVHWSVPALCCFVLGMGVRHIVTAAAWVVGYLAILLIHELGHQRVAERRGCRVLAIHIYPVHGDCMYEASGSRYDDALIAWGGPAAQLIVAAPPALFIKLIGSTHVDALDVLLGFLGVYSPIVALINLLPISPLDGRKAWTILPLTWKRIRTRRKHREPQTAMEAMEEALRKASKRRGRAR